jgi:hypothetical protein
MFPFMYNNGMRIFQAPGVVALQMEMVHETRIIPTDGRPAIPVQIHNWMGESRGHWENGNTLVVETSNLSPAPRRPTSARPAHRRERHAGERAGQADRAVHDDRAGLRSSTSSPGPTRWCSPAVVGPARVEARRRLRIFEYACHEGNVQIRNFITASRAERRAGCANARRAAASDLSGPCLTRSPMRTIVYIPA